MSRTSRCRECGVRVELMCYARDLWGDVDHAEKRIRFRGDDGHDHRGDSS